MKMQPVLVPGEVYRDLDGELVQLVGVDRELCCWIPLSQPWAAREITHCDNFVLRFHPLTLRPLNAA
jgi:hypothetical protein